MNIKIKLLNDLAKVPTRKYDTDAGYDLYAAIDKKILIHPHETVAIGTGISMELPNGTFGAIFARSGISKDRGLRPANCVGVIDPSYRGEYIVALHNDSNKNQSIEPGERIAQLVVIPFVPVEFNVVNELSDTERADGGFGSTGRV